MKKTLRIASVCNYKDICSSEMLLCFVFYILFIVIFPTEPPDDLLRHMKAYTYEYDYRLMWPYSPGVPEFNMYYFFDMFVGNIHSLLGPNGFLLIQVLAVILYATAIYWLLKGASSINWRFTLAGIILTLVINRVLLARPTTFESGFFLLAVAACQDERIKWWGHLFLGCVIACFYHLFFIFLIPLVIYRRIYIISLLAGIVGWFSYAGMDYFHVIWKVASIQSQRVNIHIAEAQTILYTLLPSLFILLPVLFYWRRDIKRLLATGWFCLLNQMRFGEIVIPTLASFAKYWDVKLSQIAVALILIALCFFRPVTRNDDSWMMLKDVVPPRSKVLCLQSDTMFKMVFGNDKLRLSPCMDAGWDTNELQAAILTAGGKGTLDPLVLKAKNFDFVVESNLKQIPEDLQLYKVAGKYRIWKVPQSFKLKSGITVTDRLSDDGPS